MHRNTLRQLAFSLIAFLSVATLAFGCGGMINGREAAEQSVAEFHQLYDDAKFADIYANAHSKFKAAGTEQKFLDLMSAVHRKFGRVIKTTNAGFNVRSFNFTTTVILTQNTLFERGSSTQVFTFQMQDGKAVLLGYDVNSNDLILT